MSRANVLATMDSFARRVVRSCNSCPDSVACAECDLARPLNDARADVAELFDAATAIAEQGLTDVQLFERMPRLRAALARVQGAQP